jgi:hypothetical protein
VPSWHRLLKSDSSRSAVSLGDSCMALPTRPALVRHHGNAGSTEQVFPNLVSDCSAECVAGCSP